MNSLIKENLTNLFNNSKNEILDYDLKKLIKNPKAFNLDLGFITNLYDDDEVKNLKTALKNPLLLSAFKAATAFPLQEQKELEKLTTDIIDSIKIINDEVEHKDTSLKNQIIFLEYDYGYQACFCGFGEGIYPILENPEYITYNYKDEIYNGIGNVDLSENFKNLTKLNDLMEELEIYEQIWDSDFYQNIVKAYKYRACLMLNEVFVKLGDNLFSKINITKPLHVYLNEHDMEAMNVFSLY